MCIHINACTCIMAFRKTIISNHCRLLSTRSRHVFAEVSGKKTAVTINLRLPGVTFSDSTTPSQKNIRSANESINNQEVNINTRPTCKVPMRKKSTTDTLQQIAKSLLRMGQALEHEHSRIKCTAAEIGVLEVGERVKSKR